MTPEQLKASILQYAIQGKLVEQRPEEGTGEELYRQIQAEKQKLIHEGKIKKEKPLAEIAEDEIPFDIPESWAILRLGQICQLLDGEKISGRKYPYLEARYLRKQDSPKFMDNGKYVEIGTKVILVDGENSGEVFKVPENGYMGSTFKILFLPKNICQEYVLSFLRYYKNKLRENKKGAAIPHLNKDIFFNLIFPLPPLTEQERIVAKIEELLPLVDRYAASYEKLEQFNAKFPEDMKKSILQYAIQGKLVEQRPEEGTGEELYQQIQAEKQKLIKEGKVKKEKPLPEISEDEIPFDIPNSWKWVRVQLVTCLNPKNNLLDDLETSFIPMALVDDGYRNNHSFEIKTWGSIKKGFTHFADGDIGIAKITPCFQNRKSVIFRNLKNGYGAGTTEFSVVRVVSELLSREYLLWFFKSAYFIDNGVKSFAGTAGQQRIYKDYLAMCLIPLPPLAEQKRIVARIEELLPLCERLK